MHLHFVVTGDVSQAHQEQESVRESQKELSQEKDQDEQQHMGGMQYQKVKLVDVSDK